jgi:PAP2 superfamily
MKKQIKVMVMLLGAFVILNVSCRKNEHYGSPCGQPAAGENDADLQNAQAMKSGANVPAQWYALAIKLARSVPNQNIGPINARAFGYIGLALYESVVPGLNKYQTIQHQLNGLQTLPKTNCGDFYFYPASANAALANMVHHMFGNASTAQNVTIDSLENSFNTMFGSIIPKDILDRSSAFGKSISNTIYSWSTTDGGDQGYLTPYPTTYVPPTGPGLWVPLTGQLAQVPYWGNNRTFIKDNATATQPAPPPAYSTDPSSQLYKEELEVYNESINQVPEHAIIAKYWAALPGPSASISVLNSVLANKNASLSIAAEAYCKVGIAISDALVSCYKTKYVYNQLRPQSYIQANFNPTWKPLLATPPFPDYTSAHSVQTGAAARVLADIFGDNNTFTDDLINSLGFAPRTFTKFSDYANEVGLSRIYGGIHVRSSDFIGLAAGDLVGTHVSALRFKRN